MKTSAEKSSSTTSTTARQTSSQPFFAKAGAGSFFAPATTVPAVQMKMAVNKPGDKFEQEADKMADRVMRMPAPAAPVKEEKLQRQPAAKLQKKDDEKIQKAPAATEKFQRKANDGAPAVGANVQTAIQNQTAGGQPLSADVRSYMEPRFGADFSSVNTHTDEKAATLNRQLNAQAFTVGNHIFFGKDKFRPESQEGKKLLAHELTHTVQQGAALQRRAGTEGENGKSMYLTSDGQMVELPSDMTGEDAARLEAGAKAAENKLGKGPPPQPVPDVKKLARKEAKKEKPKIEARSKNANKGKGKVGPKPGGLAAALKAMGASKVAQYLAAKGAPALLKGIGALQRLRHNEQTHDEAAEKLQQSEKAVVIPPSEGQSKSNTGQVNTVSGRPAPAADEIKAKQKLQESLTENIPQSIEAVDNFKRNKKAQHMGADVMTVVQGDKNAVVSTFADMEHTPPPAPPEHTPEALPPEEIAPPTPNMNLGQGAIVPLQQEHTDVSKYTKEADSKLKEEGVTQEQLDMVDSGDLAEANKEKKGLEKTAKTEPLAVQTFAQQATNQVDNDLKQEEKKDRDGLKAKRKTDLGATTQKQKGAKSALEKKREEVAAKINDIYTKAQNSVKKKLADLETQSMKRFDDGNAKAAKEFEDNVNREIDVFKAERYSGFWGKLKKAKDWLLGMDDLPQVKAIFDRNRSAFVNTLNKLVENISADNKRVIQECKDELASAKTEIKDYVDKLGPGLKDIGKKAAEEMNAKLAELDRFVNQKEQELQQKLADKQKAAIKAIDEKIEKMKEAMSGALAKLGKLLLAAAKKFFTWALQKVGYSLGEIEGIINRGAAVLKAIFTQPIPFVKNLVNAAVTGFKNFGKNFLKHLKDALFEWLTGSLEGLVLPRTWDFKGIVSVALQMIGISYPNLRKHMVKVMEEPVVAGLEKTFTLVKTLITEGPMAAWEQLKEMAGEMQDAFIEAVKDFIKTKIIEQAIQWVASIFIPGAGIIKAIISIYDTIVFFIQKAKKIAQMIGNFLGSIGEIASGNIGAAADALESGLARGLSLVISFLAQLLHLSGITNKIKGAIQKIRDKVDGVLAKVAKWIAEKAKGLIQRVLDMIRRGVQAVVGWWRARKTFRAGDGETHTLFFRGEESNAVLTIRTVEMPYTEFINRAQPGTDHAKVTAKQEAIRISGLIDRERATPPSGTLEEQERVRGEKATRVNQLLEKLKTHTSILFGTTIPNSFSGEVNSGVNAAGFGVAMLVKPLTNKNRPPESPPTSAGNVTYANLNERRHSPGGASYYIKGHLLNQQLGGPGSWSNLTPLSRSGNAQHETQAESLVKRTVDLPAIVEYAVRPNYVARGDKSTLLASINASREPADAKRIKAAIVEAEDWVPASLNLQAYILDEALQRRNTILSQSVANPIERNFESYYLSSTVRPIPVNLSVDDAMTIATLPGIGRVLAERIVAVREERRSRGIVRFSSFEQISELVSGIGASRLQALSSAGQVRLY